MRRTRGWIVADSIVGLMVVGPLLAPLFRASGLWPFPLIAEWIIYPLGLLFCPEEMMLPQWEGHVMAVCSRCYAAIGSLLWVRYSLTRPTWLSRWWGALSKRIQLSLIGAIICFWQLDVWGLNQGWWEHSHLYSVIVGLPLGLAIGLLAYTVIARMLGMRPAWERAQAQAPRPPSRQRVLSASEPFGKIS